MPAQSPSDRSGKVGRALYVVLIAAVSVNLSGVLVHPASASLYGLLDLIASLARLSVLGLFLVWVFLLHDDLNRLFSRYPIRPEAAFLQTVIPIYNLWGVWDVFSRLADRMKMEGADFAPLGPRLRRWLLASYVAFVASLGAASLADVTGAERHLPRFSLPITVSRLADACLEMTWMMMTVTVVRIINLARRRAEGGARKESA